LIISTRVARWPEPLLPGARVALIAPAGPLRNDEELQRAAHNARAFGWEPVIAEHALARTGYFAGDDATRLHDLTTAMRDRSIDGIWCLRGGYGAMRLLPEIDYDTFARMPKALLGYSDITALHAALWTRCGVVTFHAPTARQPLSQFSRDSVARAVAAHEDSCGTASDARTIRAGTARGRLAGGNLAVLAALCGTPFFPSLDGTILVLEDIDEAVYRVDRMIRQLLLSGALDACAAIAFGHCTSCSEKSDDGARSLDDVLAETADTLGIPCVAGIPVGHIPDQWTLPLGAMAELDVDARRLAVLAPHH
jgi:muramoyltetrapeptide carboxypeptidase